MLNYNKLVETFEILQNIFEIRVNSFQEKICKCCG